MRILKHFLILIISISILTLIAIQFTAVQDLAAKLTIKAQVQRAILGNAKIPDYDALSAVTCGTRSPITSPPDRAETCTMIIAGEHIYIVDVGDGSVANLRNWNIPFNKIKAVLITHMHSDHISDLADLNLVTWIGADRTKKLDVYGPRGIELITQGFEMSHKLDYLYRNMHHGDILAPLKVAGYNPITIIQESIVFDENDLKVTAFTVNHSPVEPAFGFRFDYKDRSIVISGDTTMNNNVIKNAKDADVLIHEAQSNMLVEMAREELEISGQFNAKIMEDIKNYHSTPKEAARVAKKAEVDHLILNHLSPAPDGYIAEQIFTRGLSKIFPDWTLAKDGTMIILPINSIEIEITSIE